MTEWVVCGPLVLKTLFIIMERSKPPLILTAGKFINLSLSSLVAVSAYIAFLINNYILRWLMLDHSLKNHSNIQLLKIH